MTHIRTGAVIVKIFGQPKRGREKCMRFFAEWDRKSTKAVTRPNGPVTRVHR